MNYLSLFNGISAGKLALDRLGVKVDNFYISEIDDNANKVTTEHYPEAIQLGDILRWRDWGIDWSSIDLITSGFPCQSWSMAGKQLGDRDERGMLFWVMLDIIKHAKDRNPNLKFMIENVKMKMEFEQYITHHTEKALGEVNKTLINSALVSAQNRNRYYWTNFSVTQPEDKGIHLTSILADGFTSDRVKSYCLDASYYKGGNPNQYFNKSRRQLVFNEGDVVSLASRGRYNEDGKAVQQIEIRSNTKANTLTTVSKDCLIGGVFDGTVAYRKLLVNECESLQTFPLGWCSSISNSQAYKCLGNAWTVDVISHILGCCYESGD